MDTTQSIFWIALPNGITTNEKKQHLRLSVYINPRLRSEHITTLTSFPDFLNWACTMHPDHTKFSIEVNDGTQTKVIPAYRITPPPIQSLWCSLFEPTIPVQPHEFDDYSSRPVLSYPVKNVLEYLKNFYKKLVKKARFDLPCLIPPRIDWYYGEERQEECISIYELINELVELHNLFDDHEINTEKDLSNLLNNSLEEAKVKARRRQATGRTGDTIIPPFPFNQGLVSPTVPGAFRNHDIQVDYYRTMLFHHRPARTHPKTLPDGSEAKAHFEKEIDFHQMLSALGDFPEILRRLGLIIDLYIPADSIPKTNNNPGKFKLRIVPSWSSQLPTRQNDNQASWTEDYCPWTAYDYREENALELFTAHSSTNEIDGGIWIPNKEDIELIQVDVDGAALKTLNLAATIAAHLKKDVTDKPIDSNENSGVSPIRNGGISVVRNNNADHLNNIFNRSNKLNQLLNNGPSEEPLYAEDLLRGYRLDVIDQNSNRYSLHQRFGQYKILNADGAYQIIDEGFIQPSITSSPETLDPVNELYIHESLFTWDGWSLSAPRPGKSISRTSSAPNPDEPETMPTKVNNTAMTRLGLETDFMVEHGTLPRLRYGNDYTFRVRTVDLAGNGPNLEEAKKIEAALSLDKSPIGYLKYLRFDPVNPPELVPRQLYTPIDNLNDTDTTAYAEGESLERLVIRSNYNKTTEEYAAANPAYLPFNDRHVAPPKASLQMIEEHGLLDEALDAKKSGMDQNQIREVIQNVYCLATREAGSFNDDTLDSVYFIRTGTDPASNDGYAVHTEKQLILPYLPDPWATGVVFQGLPGLKPQDLFYIDLKSNPWYEVKPFRIRIVEGSALTWWDEKKRVLNIQLPKASIIPNIRVSSKFGGNLEEMGLLQWVKDDKTSWTDQELLELENDILYGRIWLFTPFREITLVHAVQQPLDFPAQPILKITDRTENSTEAYLFGNIYVHIPSTSKVDILAEWRERIDDITKSEPELDPVPFRNHVMELPIWLDNNKEVLLKDDPNALHLENNQSRLVFNSTLAETVYKKLLNNPMNPENQEQINLATKVEKHGFGDTKYRRVCYKVRATTRFREYFPTNMSNENLIRETEEIKIDVLSSARPSKPLVKYALPTFSWQQMNENYEKVTSLRSGGVRVYLDRPWWSSGDGEMLGVVLVENIEPEREDDIYSYLTFWGQDPIRESPGLPLPTIADFKNYKEVYDANLFELPNKSVKVVCFEVKWDSERKMWYCDLELDTGNAYYPFIRLALVRFQPNSLISPTDLRISPVVLAGNVQTAPDRSLTVTRDQNQFNVYNVSVSGVTYSAKKLNVPTDTVAPSTSLMSIQVQRQLSQIEDETIGWEDVPNLDEIVVHPGSPDANGVVTWEGQVAIPEENQWYPLRLVVKEIDVFYGAQPTETYQRIVYMDIILL
ncbi:hypothetical protein [Bacillus thuringiensis]|uniref:hypothetical protein n=1 Tax=Bacillus thuringiensis TaxID=1428 RepID=UPI000BFBC099|nr:hypothetical protein [Bacillus thuringiensis]PGU27139.1 hypothetical protein COD22_06355 [Bacillus thuringiensis]